MRTNLLRILTSTTLATAALFYGCTADMPTEEPVMPAGAPPPAYELEAADSAAAPSMNAPGTTQNAAAFNTERYRAIEEQGFKDPQATPLSTFSIDVDTAGYSLVRRFITNGNLPPDGAVRIEEMLNYFDYSYEGPKDDRPFAIHASLAEAPWDKSHRLVRIDIKGKEVLQDTAPSANLVFLIDVSGSMLAANKLDLVKRSLAVLTKQLRDTDSIGIVVYAGNSGVVLEPTADHEKILDALDRLAAGGSTNGGAGIEAAYRLAEEHFHKDGVNRVILATDGDFNVGVTSESSLVKLIETKRESGIFLSVLGFGDGNYNDSTMEQLADKGNGNYAYIDTIDEAKKALGKQMMGTLYTIAKDVKIQVEFNPATVDSYRLIGYENRALADEDFNDDKKDAGDIGSGHTVTALYEVVPTAAASKKPNVDKLKYQTRGKSAKATTDELLTVKVRYKEPTGTTSQLISQTLADRPIALDAADADFRFAAAVAGFGMKLRDSKFAAKVDYAELATLAKGAVEGKDTDSRKELVALIDAASKMGTPLNGVPSYRH